VIGFRAYRSGKEAAVGRRKTNRNTPVLEPGGQLSFTMRTSESGFDRFEVYGVVWDDGRVEGDEELRQTEAAVSAGFADQLERIVSILSLSGGDDMPPATLASIRRAVEALPIKATGDELHRPYASAMEIGRQIVKDAVLQDLSDGMKNVAAAQSWIGTARTRYSAWLSRARAWSR
jgi:hypothetical protein